MSRRERGVRNFRGKEFYLRAFLSRRRAADRRAKKFRKQGKLARVITVHRSYRTARGRAKKKRYEVWVED